MCMGAMHNHTSLLVCGSQRMTSTVLPQVPSTVLCKQDISLVQILPSRQGRLTREHHTLSLPLGSWNYMCHYPSQTGTFEASTLPTEPCLQSYSHMFYILPHSVTVCGVVCSVSTTKSYLHLAYVVTLHQLGYYHTCSLDLYALSGLPLFYLCHLYIFSWIFNILL